LAPGADYKGGPSDRTGAGHADQVRPLLHLTTPDDWAAAQERGALLPLEEFVHLSTPDQVALPADRLFHGRGDVLLLVLDEEQLPEVRWEPGVPGDPESMRFPHAYGPIPVAAVVAVLPYPPRADGGFDAPDLPA
jgi:uncharacterized protein (DUF952 family)